MLPKWERRDLIPWETWEESRLQVGCGGVIEGLRVRGVSKASLLLAQADAHRDLGWWGGTWT